MPTKTLWCLGITSLLLTGCAHYRTAANLPEPRPLGKNYGSYRAPEMYHEANSIQTKEPTGTITLNQALSLALLRNPELAAYSWEIRASEARALQAALLPNPEIGVELENFAGTGQAGVLDRAESTIQLSQVIELGNKRRKRTQVASLRSDLAAWDYEIKRLDILTTVMHAFLDVQSVQGQLVLNMEMIRLAEEFLGIVSQRVAAGRTSPAEESRARVALFNAQIELNRSQGDWQNARKRLAATWGSSSPEFQEVRGDFDLSQGIPEIDQLLALIDQNPEIARWAVEMQQRRAVVALEEARKIPNPAIGAGFRRLSETKSSAFVLGLSLPIFLFNRNQGAVAEARSRLNKGEWESKATELSILTSVTQSHQLLATAYDEATTLQASVLPEARRAFETINEGFRQGRFGSLDLLDAQRTLFDARLRYLQALTRFRKAETDLERLIGQSLTVQ